MRWGADYVLLVRMSGVGNRMTKLPVNGEDDSDGPPPGFDISVAHPARVYDYWLGGKDHFEADRIAAEEVIAVRPTIIRDIRANRAFLGRVVRFLAAGLEENVSAYGGVARKE
jgi:S-adenosyl methyltransferase